MKCNLSFVLSLCLFGNRILNVRNTTIHVHTCIMDDWSYDTLVLYSKEKEAGKPEMKSIPIIEFKQSQFQFISAKCTKKRNEMK